jgi:hypothetical protein
MSEPTASPNPSRLKQAVRVAILAAIVIGVYSAGSSVDRAVRQYLGPVEHMWSDPRVLLATAAFVILLALPYVPGMEVSIALLLVLGSAGALLVYLATLLALSISFGMGRLVPTAALAGLLGWLHLTRAKVLVERVHPLPPQEKLAFLLASAPSRWAPRLLRHRYVALAIVLNLPGNALLGGGGGIGLFAGTSGLFRYPAYLLTVAIAASPIPLAVWLLGESGRSLWP